MEGVKLLDSLTFEREEREGLPPNPFFKEYGTTEIDLNNVPPGAVMSIESGGLEGEGGTEEVLSVESGGLEGEGGTEEVL